MYDICTVIVQFGMQAAYFFQYLCNRLPIRLSLLSFTLHYLATYLSVCISSALVHLFLYVHKSEVNQSCYSLSVWFFRQFIFISIYILCYISVFCACLLSSSVCLSVFSAISISVFCVRLAESQINELRTVTNGPVSIPDNQNINKQKHY